MAVHSLLKSSRAPKHSKRTVAFSPAKKELTAHQPQPVESTNELDGNGVLPSIAPFLKLPTELIAEILREVFKGTTMQPLDRSANFPTPPVLRSCQPLRNVGLKLWCKHLEAQWAFCRKFKIKELKNVSATHRSHIARYLLEKTTTWAKILDDRAANLWMLWTHTLVAMGQIDFEIAKFRSPMFEWKD